jgi:chromosome segregation protein
MYLSKIEILGFKSFANKTKLQFADGLSCIIGPNGSGKSNIVDALRWVLGEQRSSSLRSDRMENVIFSGSKNRKQLGMAEVSITIQNNENILKTEFKEVVISRRLYRSGESQYLINKTPVRLKDVINVFLDTGIGANSYSIIELKMVESMLSENKAERRQLFEEAAGVGKYKIRRKSALKKLETTRIDLNRINDIVVEIEKNVRSLSRQVGKARKYIAYSEELKKIEVDLFRYHYFHMLDEIKPLQRQLDEISKIKEDSYHQITIDEALIEEYKREMIKTEQILTKHNQNLHGIDQEVAKMNQDEAVSKTKAEEMKKTKIRNKNEIDEFGKKIELLSENLKQSQAELEISLNEKEEIDKQFLEIDSQREVEHQKIQNEKADIDELNNEFKEKFGALSTQKEKAKQYDFQLNFQQEQLEQTDEKKSVLTSSLQEIKEKLEGITAAQNATKNKYESSLKLLTQSEKHLQNLLDEKTKLEQDKNKRLAEYEQTKSRRDFFNQIIQNYEGHSKSAQFIMSQKNALDGLAEPLADLISTEEDNAQLVELALGETIHYVVIDTLKNARRAIELIKNEKKGRITFIPLEKINAIQISQEERPKELTFLLSRLKYDNKYSHLLNILLGDVVACQNLDEALTFSLRFPNYRYVTKNGETLNFGKTISGGSSAPKSASVVGRKNKLKKYNVLCNELEGAVQNIDAKIKSIEKSIIERRSQNTALKVETDTFQKSFYQYENEANQLNFTIKQQTTELQNSESKHSEIKRKIHELKHSQQSLQVEIERDQNILNELEKETILRTNEFEQKNETLQILFEEVQQTRLKVSNIQSKINNRNHDISSAKHRIKEIEDSIKNKVSENTEIDNGLAQIVADSERRRAEKIEIWDKRDQLEKEKEEVETGFQEIKSKIMIAEEQRKKYRKQHDSSVERSRALEMKIQENKMKSENLREQVLKEHNEDIEIGLPFNDLDVNETETNIESLKLRIKNLGQVNPLAVGEYDKEKERYDFLSAQRDDLLEAEKSLVDTIHKINKTARQQFLETFEQIKQNFEKVFVSFFENGEGSISLEESQDPLEADIEINVRAKGKKLQTLALLSGGEKTLTAISLLFSIYLVKPSPFCVLDEVDAPLDDINIRRFTDALNNFSDKTQFIIITHNKRTMEAAQTMYGVTMEEEGVSKLVSVKFN